MPNKFRIAGNVYISKAGSDANNGTTADTPKATIGAGAAVVGAIKVIGAGFYQEAPNFRENLTWRADGIVIVNGNGAVLSVGYNNIFYGIRFENFSGGGGLNQPTSYYDCTFVNIPKFNQGIGASQTQVYTRCIFINCDMTLSTAGGTGFYDCIFVNSPAIKVNAFTNSYANGATNLLFVAGIAYANIRNNNIMGGIAYAEAGTGTVGIIQDTTGFYYNLALAGTGGTGTEADPYWRDNTIGKMFYLAESKKAYPTSNPASFNLPPLFNNVAKEDFSLQYNSPHIGKSSTGGNIGATGYGKALYSSTAPEFQPENGAVYAGLELFGQDIVISAGQTFGTITTAPIRIAANPETIERLVFLGALLFNKSAAGGSATNKNVPDAAVYAGDDASGGGNPDRLSIEMRFTAADTLPAMEEDWNNGGYMAPGAFGKFLINERPLIDGAGRGNAEPDFDTISNQSVSAVWVQVRVTLTNAYL